MAAEKAVAEVQRELKGVIKLMNDGAKTMEDVCLAMAKREPAVALSGLLAFIADSDKRIKNVDRTRAASVFASCLLYKGDHFWVPLSKQSRSVVNEKLQDLIHSPVSIEGVREMCFSVVICSCAYVFVKCPLFQPRWKPDFVSTVTCAERNSQACVCWLLELALEFNYTDNLVDCLREQVLVSLVYCWTTRTTANYFELFTRNVEQERNNVVFIADHLRDMMMKCGEGWSDAFCAAAVVFLCSQAVMEASYRSFPNVVVAVENLYLEVMRSPVALENIISTTTIIVSRTSVATVECAKTLYMPLLVKNEIEMLRKRGGTHKKGVCRRSGDRKCACKAVNGIQHYSECFARASVFFYCLKQSTDDLYMVQLVNLFSQYVFGQIAYASAHDYEDGFAWLAATHMRETEVPWLIADNGDFDVMKRLVPHSGFVNTTVHRMAAIAYAALQTIRFHPISPFSFSKVDHSKHSTSVVRYYLSAVSQAMNHKKWLLAIFLLRFLARNETACNLLQPLHRLVQIWTIYAVTSVLCAVIDDEGYSMSGADARYILTVLKAVHTQQKSKEVVEEKFADLKSFSVVFLLYANMLFYAVAGGSTVLLSAFKKMKQNLEQIKKKEQIFLCDVTVLRPGSRSQPLVIPIPKNLTVSVGVVLPDEYLLEVSQQVVLHSERAVPCAAVKCRQPFPGIHERFQMYDVVATVCNLDCKTVYHAECLFSRPLGALEVARCKQCSSTFAKFVLKKAEGNLLSSYTANELQLLLDKAKPKENVTLESMLTAVLKDKSVGAADIKRKPLRRADRSRGKGKAAKETQENQTGNAKSEMSTASNDAVHDQKVQSTSIDLVSRNRGLAQDDCKESAVKEECECSHSVKLKPGPSRKQNTELRQSTSYKRLDHKESQTKLDTTEMPSPQGNASPVCSDDDWEVVSKSKTPKTKTLSPSDKTAANVPKAKKPKKKRNEKKVEMAKLRESDERKSKGGSKAAKSSTSKTDLKPGTSPVVLPKPPVSTDLHNMTTFSAIVTGNTSHVKRVEPLPAVPEPDAAMPEAVDEFAELDALLSQYVVSDSESSEVETEVELYSDPVVQSHDAGQALGTFNATPLSSEEDGQRKMMNLVERMREVYPGLSVEQYMTLMGLCRDEIRRDRADPQLVVPACDILERLKVQLADVRKQIAEMYR